MMVKTFDEAYELLKPYESDFFMSIMLAQWALESARGTSELAINANNFTGHKAGSDWSKDKVYYKDTFEDDGEGNLYLAKSESFRLYDSPSEWAKYHAGWMQRKPGVYTKAIQAKTVEEQARALTGTYATDTSYATKLLNVIKQNNLTKYDEESVPMTYPQPKMIDRRKRALGYPGHGAYAKRSISAIKQIVRHYTAVNRRGGESNTIKAHEDYWRSHHGWDIGGYGIYIDFEGTIYHNYDFEIVTYGAGRLNPQLFHVCLEGSSLANHSPAQLKALDDVMVWLLTGPLKHLGGNDIRGHWEIPYNSTSCPGMTKAQLDAYRVKISKMIEQDWTGDTSQPDEIAVSKSGKYTVKHGDTLWAIAKAHDETVDNLQKWNKIADGQWLKTGQELYVTEPKQNAYTVVKGDYLYKIAQEHGVSVADLKAWNSLETNLIYAGQELFVKDPEIKNLEEPPASDEMPVEEVDVETPEDTPETPALELKENQYLRWDGIVVEVKEVK